jgi:hypothetical protein
MKRALIFVAALTLKTTWGQDLPMLGQLPFREMLRVEP